MTLVQPGSADYGTAILRHDAPDDRLPEHGIPPVGATRRAGCTSSTAGA